MMPSGSSSASGSNSDAAGLQPVADPDRADRADDAVQPLGDADRLQHPPGRAGDRGGAAVIARRDLLFRIGGIDDDGREAVPVERDRQGQPDQAAAEDDDVRCAPFLRALALHSVRNAKRLTRESARAHEEPGNIWGTSDGGSVSAKGPARPSRRSCATARSALARRSGSFVGGIALASFALFALLALISYQPSDPVARTPRRRAGRATGWAAPAPGRPICC